jgi:hypothetical protein
MLTTPIAIMTDVRLRPRRGGDADRGQQAGDRQHDVDDAHDEAVDPPAEGAGDQAEQDAGARADGHRHDPMSSE